MKYYFFSQFWLSLPSWGAIGMGALGSLLLLFAERSGQTPVWTATVEAAAIAQGSVALPQVVDNAVIQDVVSRTGLPADAFVIVAAEQRDWPNSCLGLSEPGVVCAQVIVPGWRVVLEAGDQQWVYRTDAAGSQVKLVNSGTAPGDEDIYIDIAGHWAQNCIQRLSQEGSVSGYPDHTFRPEAPITRAEYASLLNRTFPYGAPERQAANFWDVPVDYWAQPAIQAAYQQGFLSGYPSREFRPYALISRVEAYVALARGLDYATPPASQAVLMNVYTDAARIPDYARGAIAAVTEAGIVIRPAAGASALNPEEPVTRAQVAASLCQIKYDDVSVSDRYVFNVIESPSQGNRIVLGQTCENEASGFTVRYPTDWLTNDGSVTEVCRYFDPAAITVPERSSSLDEAIHIRVDNIPYNRATRLEDPTARVLSRRSTTVDGRDAIVTETQATGRGLLPAGVTTYTYIVDLDRRQSLIATTYDYAEQPYERNKQVLDQMIETLTFVR